MDHYLSYSLGIIVLFGFLIIACERPPSSFNRGNDNDPGNISYVPAGPDTIIVDSYSEELIEIKWIDRIFTQQTYMLERRINDGSFDVLMEFEIMEPQDSIIFRDTASVYGDYTYQVTGYYQDYFIQSTLSQSYEAKNWLKVAPGTYPSGGLVILDQARILAYSDRGAEIYSHKTLSWSELDVSFCRRKVSNIKKLESGNVAVLCTSSQLEEDQVGIFILDISSLQWDLTGILKRKAKAFDLNRNSLRLVPLVDDNMFILGLSSKITGQFHYLFASLFTNQINTVKPVDPDSHEVPAYYNTDDSIGLELTDGRIFVHTESTGTDNNSLIFDPSNESWQTLPPKRAESRSVHKAIILNDGRVLTFAGGGGGFSSIIYNPAVNDWSYTGQSTLSTIYSGKLIKLQNGRVVTIDSGGNVYMFNSSTDSWRLLQSSADPKKIFSMVQPLYIVTISS